MSHYRNTVRHAAASILLLALSSSSLHAIAALTLADAEQLALSDDPAVAASRARSQALREDAVASGQLPDPKLKAGLFNLPLDTLDIDQEPTTQLRLGLQQAFPRGATLKHRQRQTEWKATAEQARAEDESRKLVREVRNSFLELYYQLQAEQVVINTRTLFAQLVDITQAHYATGRVSQQDVLRAALELSRLDDRATRIRNEQEKTRAILSKWIGNSASQTLDPNFPVLMDLPSKEELTAALEQHPVILAESARLESHNQAVQIAREQYNPGWGVGLEYRKRFGENPDASDRTDMMAAMVTVDLPLFPGKRQDRRLAASLQQAEAAQLTRADRLRELRTMLESDYASWLRLGERAALYETQLLREARANVQASLNAYQNGVTEFTTLMRARITDLDVRLDELRLRVDRAKAQAGLLYLAGEKQ
jgi:outer membrane protein TolC